MIEGRVRVQEFQSLKKSIKIPARPVKIAKQTFSLRSGLHLSDYAS
jgi:hypothetical protein